MRSEFLVLAAIGGIASAAAMAAAWAWHLRVRHAAVADAGWAAVIAGLAILDATRGTGMPGRRIAIASMMGSWGVQLAVYILYGRVFGKSDSTAGRGTWWTFQRRAIGAVYFSLPALVASINPAPNFSIAEEVAAALWVVGFAGGSTAERQRFHFTMEPANEGRRCDTGLWRLAIDPTAVFDVVVWTAFAVFAIASPWGWIAAACPAIRLWQHRRALGLDAFWRRASASDRAA